MVVTTRRSSIPRLFFILAKNSGGAERVGAEPPKARSSGSRSRGPEDAPTPLSDRPRRADPDRPERRGDKTLHHRHQRHADGETQHAMQRRPGEPFDETRLRARRRARWCARPPPAPCQPMPASEWVMIEPPTQSIASVPTKVRTFRKPGMPSTIPRPIARPGAVRPLGAQVQADVVGLHDQRDRSVDQHRDPHPRERQRNRLENHGLGLDGGQRDGHDLRRQDEVGLDGTA
jgi:hypothetical protein